MVQRGFYLSFAWITGPLWLLPNCKGLLLGQVKTDSACLSFFPLSVQLDAGVQNPLLRPRPVFPPQSHMSLPAPRIGPRPQFHNYAQQPLPGPPMSNSAQFIHGTPAWQNVQPEQSFRYGLPNAALPDQFRPTTASQGMRLVMWTVLCPYHLCQWLAR